MPNAPANAAPDHTPRDLLLEHIGHATPRSLPAQHKDKFVAFLPWYYGGMPLHELDVINAEDLNGIALSHWQLMQARPAGEIKCRVYNPTVGSDGWQSPHTIIELVSMDQQWLVASLSSMLVRLGHSVHLLIHPVLSVERDKQGNCTGVSRKNGQSGKNATTESLIHIQIDCVDDESLATLESQVHETLDLLAIIKQDSPAMQQQLQALAAKGQDDEQSAFFGWLAERQFACLGIIDIAIKNHTPVSSESTVELGLLSANVPIATWTADALLPAESISALQQSGSVVITKAGLRSPVIRDEQVDLIMLLERDKHDELNRIYCIAGLFVPGLQRETTDSVPILRERVESAIRASDTVPDSHGGKALASVLRGFPRNMLLQTPTQTLLDMAIGIVRLHERRQIRLFHSDDPMGRFCHCLVYIPREAYSRELRLDIEDILQSTIVGMGTEFHTQFSSESALARLHFVIQKRPPLNRDIDWASIESRIRLSAITWNDRLQDTLREKFDEHHALALYRRYENAFPASYREDYSARVAVADIEFIEQWVKPGAPVMSFYRHIVADAGTINFKLFSHTHTVSLSDVIPVIENMGLRVEAEHPFEIKRNGDATVWMHEFTVEQIGRSKLDQARSADNIQKAFSQIWRGAVENDGFNRLILEAGLSWRQVVVLRSYCKYLLQIGVPFSQTYMIDSLVANADIAGMLIGLFESRFDPALTDRNSEQQVADIEAALDKVDSLDQDRILRGYLNLVQSTLRTNAFCTSKDGYPLDYVSYKFDCSAIDDLPLPKPQAEVFVYSPRFEAVHLRGGKVARGGLRWSDRREDFRTEVLGLMKAQMVKNAVIVPVGSKGGFYVKQTLDTDRSIMMEQVVDCYQTFLRGLLDITDNIVGSDVVAPPDVVRFDGDDPYLVVAADKGTATFSDFANAVSAEYGFWLGDAFASGGSVGYDHKKMGITARGAWESVKRHFRELGIDCQNEEFTAAGIGDMSGDVFGNGMLLSPKIKLVAAFNHQHIFLDPNPDVDASFAERKRLFELPRSSWTDYDSSLVSAGGGIYSRNDKKITLGPEVRELLQTKSTALTPTELISAILKAPVDLLWNGGIGTYIKSSLETHADAADRANDVLRVNASELCARVLGEGGNLGCTQLGRIEFARAGGMVYTDAIDNSAGVDCSDHEVNIKILLNSVVANQDMTSKQRDEILADMTDEVGSLVLKDNYLQTQCINQCFLGGSDSLDEYQRFMQHLESIDRLNRDIEFLPDNEQFAERIAADEGLSRPEIAVIVSYSKMVMHDQLIDSNFTNDPALEKVITSYMPKRLGRDFSEQIAEHRLRSEIICTEVTNDLVNRLGPTFAYRMHHELGATVERVASAYFATREIFHLDEIWSSIENLDNKVDAHIQNQMQILVRGLIERSVHWLLRTRRGNHSIDSLVEYFQHGIGQLNYAMPDCLAQSSRTTLDQRVSYFVNAAVPDQIATAVARVVPQSSSLDIVDIAVSSDKSVELVSGVYFSLGHHLELQWLREQIGTLSVRSHWHTLSKSELRSDLHYQQRHLTAEVVSTSDSKTDASELVSNWAARNTTAVAKYQDLVTEMKASAVVDFAMLSLAVNEVHKLLKSDRPLA